MDNYFMKSETVTNLVKILGDMKSLKRKGWIYRNVNDSESDAEHCFSLAMLVLLLAPKKLDLLKCLKMALLHDVPEIFCGDFVPGEIDETTKHNIECEAMDKVVSLLERADFRELFEEFENKSSDEAKFVWALDRLDNVFTARYYENNQGISLVEEFSQGAYARAETLDEDMKNKLFDILSSLRS